MLLKQHNGRIALRYTGGPPTGAHGFVDKLTENKLVSNVDIFRSILASE